MKLISTLVATHLTRRRQRGNLRVLLGLIAFIVVIVLAYSVLFHVLMAREGQTHSWLTGFYWTMVSMSTLGFGDVTFHSDLGRMFSVLVLTTGTVLMLILLPFTFIQFFYAPWLEAREAARAPRALPASTTGHVLLTAYGPVDRALAQRLRQFQTPYVVIVPDVTAALALSDEDVPVMVGELDDADTYRRALVERAALAVATQSDPLNTNIAATIRECSGQVPIVSLASSEASVDILELAGCQQVFRLGELLGQSMARRVFGRDGRSHAIGEFDHIVIAEAAAAGTSLVGHTLREIALRVRLNLSVAGIWERGHFTLAHPDTLITRNTMLLLAGTADQLAAYDREFALAGNAPTLVLIIGGGRVGRAAARALAERDIEYRIVEKVAGRTLDPTKTVVGDAADLDVLQEAGLAQASCVLVTTHADDVNIYLTLYCRRLRPDLLILSRATLERNATTLHRAGADFVLSYSTIGANAIFNMLRRSSLLCVAEGLDVFTTPVPKALVGRTLADSGLRRETGCHALALRQNGKALVDLDINAPLPKGAELVLLGDRLAEDRFFRRYQS